MIPALRRSVLLLLVVFVHGGCVFAPRAPSIDIIGSYFPAWIVCAVLGIAFSIIIRLLLIGARLDGYVGPRAIFYPCLTLSIALAIWLVFYSV